MDSSSQGKLAQGSSREINLSDTEFSRQLTEDSLRRQAEGILRLTRPESVDEDECELVEEPKVKSKKKSKKTAKPKKKAKKAESPESPPYSKPNGTCQAEELSGGTASDAVASAPASCSTNFDSPSSTTHISMSKSKIPRPSVSGQTLPGAERVEGMESRTSRRVTGLQEDYDIEQGVLHAPPRDSSEELHTTFSNARDGDVIENGGQITAKAVTRAELEEEVRNRLMSEVVTAQVIAVSDQPCAFENVLSTSNTDLEKSSSEETTVSMWTKKRSLVLKMLLILLAAALAAIVVVLLLSWHSGGEGSGYYIENGNAQQASSSEMEDGDTSGAAQDVPRLDDD